MSTLNPTYRLIEANLTNCMDEIATISNRIANAALSDAIGASEGGQIRTVDLLADDDLMAFIRTIRAIIIQIGVAMEARKIDER